MFCLFVCLFVGLFVCLFCFDRLYSLVCRRATTNKIISMRRLKKLLFLSSFAALAHHMQRASKCSGQLKTKHESHPCVTKRIRLNITTATAVFRSAVVAASSMWIWRGGQGAPLTTVRTRLERERAQMGAPRYAKGRVFRRS